MKNNTSNRLPILSVVIEPGNLFEEISDEGDIFHFYHVSTVVQLQDGRLFTHEFSPYGHGATEKAQAFADKVRAAGTIDPTLWFETFAGPTLEERFESYGLEWQHEREVI